MSTLKYKRVIIVGGVAGGASAAARLRRLDEDVEILMFERGGYISFANCGLPYYIGNTIKDRDKLLVQTEAGMEQRFNIDIRVNSEVTKILRDEKVVEVNSEGKIYREFSVIPWCIPYNTTNSRYSKEWDFCT
jgi:NADPH-dependent 2,4-dienoyl-CoA reductase/sulfur reductase-like enzyme